MSKDKDAAIGCLMHLLRLFVLLPLWLSIMFGVLTHIDAPTWLWVVFWIYAPSILVIGLLTGIVEAALKSD